MNIGIIGFGRFGRLLLQYFKQDHSISVYSASVPEEEISKEGGRKAGLKEICKQEIVIPCVPISAFESVIKEISSLLGPSTIVVDICSVKEYPVEVMKKHLTNPILATHPMFGPDSAINSLKGLKIVLCNSSLDQKRYQEIKQCLEKKELTVIETTPEVHDKQIAISLCLTHFIGRGLIKCEARNLEIDTQGYQRLLCILSHVKNDTAQLFQDMNTYNRYASGTREKFMQALKQIDDKLQVSP